MATDFSLKALAVLASALLLFVRGALGGGVTCENLEKDACAFAVSSSGTRCVLEKHVKRGGEEVYACRASDIQADKLKDWIESDECVEACGVDRRTVGISSDALLDSRFTQKLCSSRCHGRCPNIVDLYFNLAAGEGVFLPKLCETHGANGRRGMAEIRSSGIAASAPYYSMSMHSKDGIEAPAPYYVMHSKTGIEAPAPYYVMHSKTGIEAPAPYYGMHSNAGFAAPGPDHGMHSNAGFAAPGPDHGMHSNAGFAAPGPDHGMHSNAGFAAPGPDYGMHSNAMVAPAMAPY